MHKADHMQQADTDRKPISLFSKRWYMFKRNKIAMMGGIILLLFYILAIFANFFAPYNPQEMTDYRNASPQRIHFRLDGQFVLPFVYGLIQVRDSETLRRVWVPDEAINHRIKLFVPSERYNLFGLIPASRKLVGVDTGPFYLLGTDRFGRDLLSRIIAGAQISLWLPLLGMIISTIIGTIIGMISGYFGGIIDIVLQRIIEVIASFPRLPLWIALGAAIPPEIPPLTVFVLIVIVLASIGWAQLARQIRGKVLSIREEDYIKAARSIGTSIPRILFKHILPNTLTHVIVIATLSIPTFILAESSLSFLGLGITPPLISWGVLLKDAQSIQIILQQPWLLIPGVIITITMLAFSFVGDGIRDAFDPNFQYKELTIRSTDKGAEKNCHKMPDNVVLSVEGLKTHFPIMEGVVNAVNGVSFVVKPNTTIGVIGESGCGKSITALSLINLVPAPGRIVSGNILYRDKDQVVNLCNMNPKGRKIRKIRGKEISMIFQDPMTSLNPVYTIGDQIMETLIYHQELDKKIARNKAIESLNMVGFPHPDKRIDCYPHQLSGGLRQRVMIAMALCCEPTLLIADEPTTALDVTIQAQILQLMNNIQEKYRMSIIFISHDLGVINEICDEAVVMYLGRIIEYATVKELFNNPLHPYTRALIHSMPMLATEGNMKLSPISGSVAVPINLKPGCHFLSRCTEKKDFCFKERVPDLIEKNKSHWVRCWLYD